MKLLLSWLALLVVCCGTVLAEKPVKDDDYIQEETKRLVQKLCRDKHCGIGRTCIIEEGEATCVCSTKCPVTEEPRDQVCSNQNVTFSSECELYRQQCLCNREEEGCVDPKYEHAWLDYYGACKEFKTCKNWEMQEYPKRMRKWLTDIMAELSKRNHLTSAAAKLAKESPKKEKHWIMPVIWKFCDLDKSHNKLVSYFEMLPLAAPLKTMEHCTQPFLDQCDKNDDSEISLEEWGKCLGLEKDEIEDKCDVLTGKETLEEKE